MYVIVGANGYIGAYMIKNILEKTNHKILGLGRNINLDNKNPRVEYMRCDITEVNDISKLIVRLSGEKNIKVIYLAAYHHPDAVKNNPRIAWNINITSLSYIVNALDNIQCFFYVSTEMVYGEGNLNNLFTEQDALNPVNLYGIQKKVAEAIVLGYGYNIVRFPFVIGKSLSPDKKHFYDVIIDTIRKGNEIDMFCDAYKSALDFDTATSVVVQLMEIYQEDLPKILNISGDETLSKYDIGVRIAKANNFNTDLIKPIYLNQDKKIFTENRANCTLLDNTLVKEILGIDELKMKF